MLHKPLDRMAGGRGDRGTDRSICTTAARLCGPDPMAIRGHPPPRAVRRSDGSATGAGNPHESIKKLGVRPPGAPLPAADLDTSVGTSLRAPDSGFSPAFAIGGAHCAWSIASAGACRSVY